MIVAHGPWVCFLVPIDNSVHLVVIISCLVLVYHMLPIPARKGNPPSDVVAHVDEMNAKLQAWTSQRVHLQARLRDFLIECDSVRRSAKARTERLTNLSISSFREHSNRMLQAFTLTTKDALLKLEMSGERDAIRKDQLEARRSELVKPQAHRIEQVLHRMDESKGEEELSPEPPTGSGANVVVLPTTSVNSSQPTVVDVLLVDNMKSKAENKSSIEYIKDHSQPVPRLHRALKWSSMPLKWSSITILVIALLFRIPVIWQLCAMRFPLVTNNLVLMGERIVRFLRPYLILKPATEPMVVLTRCNLNQGVASSVYMKYPSGVRLRKSCRIASRHFAFHPDGTHGLWLKASVQDLRIQWKTTKQTVKAGWDTLKRAFG